MRYSCCLCLNLSVTLHFINFISFSVSPSINLYFHLSLPSLIYHISFICCYPCLLSITIRSPLHLLPLILLAFVSASCSVSPSPWQLHSLFCSFVSSSASHSRNLHHDIFPSPSHKLRNYFPIYTLSFSHFYFFASLSFYYFNSQYFYFIISISFPVNRTAFRHPFENFDKLTGRLKQINYLLTAAWTIPLVFHFHFSVSTYQLHAQSVTGY